MFSVFAALSTMNVRFVLTFFVLIFAELATPVIIITKGTNTSEPLTVQDVTGPIGTNFYVREQSKIGIMADFIINTTEAAEARTMWYYHSTLEGTRTLLQETLTFLPGGSIGFMITNLPWSANDSYTIFTRADGTRSEYLEIPTAFPVHEGFITFRVDVDNFPSQEATSEIRITYPPTTAPTTPAPIQPPVNCSRPLDVFFAIDGSGSLGSAEFSTEINFVIDSIRSFASPMNRYGYIVFASDIQESVELNSNSSAVIEKLRVQDYSGGRTSFLTALSEIFDKHFTPNNIREGASRVLFFLADGRSEGDFPSIVQEAEKLIEQSKVEIITVEFGNPDLDQLAMIATNYNFNFSTIQEARAAVRSIVQVACPTIPSCCEGPLGFRGERGQSGFRGDAGDNGKNGICVKLEECLLIGLRGRAGLTGSPGEKGASGNQGSKGDMGAKGMTGDQGSGGVKGSQGDKGFKGDPGIRGNQGSTGESGEKGSSGGLGSIGEKGIEGLKGAKGKLGQTGVCNFQECMGDQGVTGNKGTKGLEGFVGGRGDKGDKGSTGNKGGVGLKGSIGLNGIEGETGETGEAIEKRAYQDEARNCTTDGSLLYDTESNRIYYCSNGQHLCVGKEPC